MDQPAANEAATMITFFTPGAPIAKGNHRINRSAGRIYDAAGAALTAWEKTVSYCASIAPRDGWRIDLPVTMTVEFLIPREVIQGKPGKQRKIRRQGTLPGKRGTGDLDKLLRAIGDALEGVLLNDDSQIVSITASKRFTVAGEIPGAQVTLLRAPGAQVAL
ncbi:MAG: RusA family crossover junction endodeoxyribonuclease [bacterium]|nr:RusA family crossover junction endodeoxyribonuclease [bacterium]